MRLAVLVTHPVQYFAPVFRELVQYPKIEMKVFFGCDHGVKASKDPGFGTVFQWDSQPTEGFESHFLSRGSLETLNGVSGILLASKALVEIRRYRPDHVLIFAYTPLFIAISTIGLRLAGFPLMLRAETSDEALERSWLKATVREWFLRFYYRQFDHFFPIGTNSFRHYRKMGILENHLTLAHYAIDVDFFQEQVKKWNPQRQKLRESQGIASKEHVLLFCGKMYWPKNPLLIAEALRFLSKKEKEQIWFLAVGTGELKKQFEESIQEQLGERALFVGFKNQSELGQYYAMADTLVLPSQSGETWGLVVNEALQFGLRVIVSDKVGSGCDLLKDPQQGVIFPSCDAKALSGKIAYVIQQETDSPGEMKDLPHPQDFAQKIHSRMERL